MRNGAITLPTISNRSPVAAPGSGLSRQSILQRHVGMHALEPRKLGLDFPHAPQLRHLYAGVPGLSDVVGRLANAVLAGGITAARLGNLRADFYLAQDPVGLFLAEFRLLRAELFLAGTLLPTGSS